MLKIDLAPYDRGVHQIKLEPQADELGLDPEKFRDLQVDVRLDIVDERRILVMLDARARAELECDRTLRLFDQMIEGRFSVLFASPGTVAMEEDEDQDVRILPSGQNEIDLTETVRDTLLLAVPARCLAPGAEEEEIPTSFGVSEDERDIDPRWEALRQLKVEKQEGK